MSARPASEVFREYLPSLLTLLGVVLLLAFVAAPARVSGDSMNPTLHSGDLLLLLKYPRWQADFPHRGDIVVFRGSEGSPYSYETRTVLGISQRVRPTHIKRVLAVGGDRIEMRSGQVWVNGAAVAEPYTAALSPDSFPPRTLASGEIWVMGDNRHIGSSLDSRTYGPLQRANIVGRVSYRLWPDAGTLP